MMSNSIILSAIIVAFAGILVLNIKNILNFFSDLILNFMFHSVRVEESSDFFYALQRYVIKENSHKVKNHYYRNIYDNFIERYGFDRTNLFYNYGYFWLKNKDGRVFVTKINESIPNSMTPYKNTKQSIKIYSLREKPLKTLINYVEENYVNNIINYYFNNDGEVKLLNEIIPKTFDNIFLNDNLVDKIKDDLTKFQKSKEKYLSLGIKYKRTYLFYGVAGTGKSSIAIAIANYTKRNVLSINVSKDMSDATLIKLISNRPNKSIILLEDIDCLFDNLNREKEEGEKDTKNENKVKITLSCLLNILDGSYTPNDVIFVLTTNHIDKLDDAIKRDGRTDVLMEIGKPNLETKKKYLEYVKKFNNFVSDVDLTEDVTLSTLEKQLLN